MRRRKKISLEIDPDEILLDASNLPKFDTQQFEGRMERALSGRAIKFLAAGFLLVGLGYSYQLGKLQIVEGSNFRTRSEDNSLRLVTIPTERGVIYDRNGELLAWNDPEGGREYVRTPGVTHVIGYLGLPTEEELAEQVVKDPNIRVGKMGIEKEYDTMLRGIIGEKYEEVNSLGVLASENMRINPVDGSQVKLSIDSRLQGALYKYMEAVAEERDFTGGAGVLMDVQTGEVIALVSYPEFPLDIVSGTTTKSLQSLLNDKGTPFLNRAISGTYAPGSVIKPYMAVGALSEHVISPEKEILSTGKLEIPNPYSPGVVSIFKDWKAHGLIDMRHALAVSSNVYFYEVGGGYKDQKGIGIANINKYTRLFGFGSETGIDLPGEVPGIVPSPDWKKEVFAEDWRLGDTYHTVIGQYGFQVTPIQMVRAVAALANNGTLVTPSLFGLSNNQIKLPVPEKDLQVVREGMKLATEIGTAQALNVSYTKFGAKTGTAELGETRQRVNSWVEGFFPYDHPRYAFAIVMERGHVGNVIGAAYIARQFFDWVSIYAPEYYEY